MKRLRDYYLSRLLREKVLLLALLAIAAAIWSSSLLRRLQVATQTHVQVGTDLAVQDQWLAQQERIEALAKTAIEHLDPAKSLDSVRLTAEVSDMASAAGITANRQIDSTRTERTPEFAVHSIEFRARRANYADLQKFYFKIVERAPYVGLEQFSLSTVPSRPSEIEAVFRITSVEIAR
ncbi:MAG: hypothetical protein JNJ82_21905 [Opitutaceae bacterium]|nr:hypothetical protein [Opitutaceae bacterium]